MVSETKWADTSEEAVEKICNFAAEQAAEIALLGISTLDSIGLAIYRGMLAGVTTGCENMREAISQLLRHASQEMVGVENICQNIVAEAMRTAELLPKDE